MKKIEFLQTLRERLKAFQKSEVQSIIDYYEELIEEKKETGIKEEEVIASFGSIENIIPKVTADLVFTRSSTQQTSPLKNFWIILGICASPILIPIGIALGAIVFSLVIVVFSLLISLLASEVAIIVSLIPMVISMIVSGTDFSIIILTIGLCLIAIAILFYLSLLTIQVGKKALQSINRFFSKRIKQKTEVNKNENI